MTNDQFIAAIEQLIAACRSSAAANPEAKDIWLDRAEALEAIVESESGDPVMLMQTLTRSNQYEPISRKRLPSIAARIRESISGASPGGSRIPEE